MTAGACVAGFRQPGAAVGVGVATGNWPVPPPGGTSRRVNGLTITAVALVVVSTTGRCRVVLGPVVVVVLVVGTEVVAGPVVVVLVVGGRVVADVATDVAPRAGVSVRIAV